MTRVLERSISICPCAEEIVSTISAGLGLEDSLRVLAAKEIFHRPELLARLVEEYRALYVVEGEELTEMFPGWEQTLTTLDSLGVQTAIVSNKSVAAINVTLSRSGFERRISHVFGQVPGMPQKPDLRLFDEFVAPNFLDLSRSEILVVGDTACDLEFARNIGADCCWAAFGYGQSEACERLKPEFTVHRAEELVDIVRGI